MRDHRENIDWVAVDWGTTHLRAWAMSGGKAGEGRSSDRGMGKLAKADYEPALLDLLGGWHTGPLRVIACGMVGSRQGWVEAPYRTVPCAPLTGGLVQAPTTTKGLDVRVIPGIRQESPADVMRGEETQIAGFLALNPNWDGVLCLPGTHTKWVHVSAGEVVSFQTFMTGEMFAVLGANTVLRHSISADGWNARAFDEALGESLSRPERMAARLFSLRADSLLHGLDGTAARSRLSGTLIGAELAAARPYWLGQNVAVLGADFVSGLYAKALAGQGVAAASTDGQTATLAGLKAAYDLTQAQS